MGRSCLSVECAHDWRWLGTSAAVSPSRAPPAPPPRERPPALAGVAQTAENCRRTARKTAENRRRRWGRGALAVLIARRSSRKQPGRGAPEESTDACGFGSHCRLHSSGECGSRRRHAAAWRADRAGRRGTRAARRCAGPSGPSPRAPPPPPDTAHATHAVRRPTNRGAMKTPRRTHTRIPVNHVKHCDATAALIATGSTSRSSPR